MKFRWVNITNDELENNLSLMRQGYAPEASLLLIDYFNEKLQSGSSYNKRILEEFISIAFNRFVENNYGVFASHFDDEHEPVKKQRAPMTLDQAFSLKLRSGHYQRADTTDRDLGITATIVYLGRRGMTWLDAKETAAGVFFGEEDGSRACDQAYSIYKDELENWSDETLLDFVPESLRS